jgi:hypothetical protein
MTTLLSILISLFLGYGLGFFHSSYLESEDKDFWFSWKNPLLYAIVIVAIPFYIVTDGWKNTIQGLKDIIQELNEQ